MNSTEAVSGAATASKPQVVVTDPLCAWDWRLGSNEKCDESESVDQAGDHGLRGRPAAEADDPDWDLTLLHGLDRGP